MRITNLIRSFVAKVARDQSARKIKDIATLLFFSAVIIFFGALSLKMAVLVIFD